MTTEKSNLDEEKKKAAEAAKAAARKKMEEMKAGKVTSDQGSPSTTAEPKTVPTPSEEEAKAAAIALAKAKAAAAAKAKAAALAKEKGEPTSSEEGEKAKEIALAKAKAVAAAKAKAAALAKEKGEPASSEGDEKAKAIAAAKAKAAALAKGKQTSTEEAPTATKPSPNQPYLNKYIQIIKEQLGEDCLEDSYINPLSKDVPTVVVHREFYNKLCQVLKQHDQLSFDYLSNLHGTDYVTHFELYLHLYSYTHSQSIAVKVKVDRQNPIVDSVTPIWQGANWPEREAYDLLGITFTNHPNMKRILLSDEWVGYPLRKDYVPYDEEV